MLDIEASLTCTAATGVEMEALTVASVAALTVYDMCKAAHKGICISEIKLICKAHPQGGRQVGRVDAVGPQLTARARDCVLTASCLTPFTRRPPGGGVFDMHGE